MTTETTRTLEDRAISMERHCEHVMEGACVRCWLAFVRAEVEAASRASPEEGRLMVDEDVMLSQGAEIDRLETALREIAASQSDAVGMRALARAALCFPPAPKVGCAPRRLFALSATRPAPHSRGRRRRGTAVRSEADHYFSEFAKSVDREQASSAEVARLRAEAEEAESRGFAAGVEAAARCLISCWLDGAQGPSRADVEQYAEVQMIRALGEDKP